MEYKFKKQVKDEVVEFKTVLARSEGGGLEVESLSLNQSVYVNDLEAGIKVIKRGGDGKPYSVVVDIELIDGQFVVLMGDGTFVAIDPSQVSHWYPKTKEIRLTPDRPKEESMPEILPYSPKNKNKHKGR